MLARYRESRGPSRSRSVLAGLYRGWARAPAALLLPAPQSFRYRCQSSTELDGNVHLKMCRWDFDRIHGATIRHRAGTERTGENPLCSVLAFMSAQPVGVDEPSAATTALSRAPNAVMLHTGATRLIRAGSEPAAPRGRPQEQAHRVVRKGGLEPLRYCYRQPLNLSDIGSVLDGIRRSRARGNRRSNFAEIHSAAIRR